MKSIAFTAFITLLLTIGRLLNAGPPANNNSIEDSLLNVVRSAGTDSVIVQNYIKLSDLFTYNQSNKAIEYAQKALSLAQETDYPLGIARGYERIATAHFQLGNNELAESNYLKAREANERAGNYEIEGSVLYNLGNIQYELGNYDQSTSYAREAGVVFLSHGDSIGYGVTLYMISGNHGASGNYELAVRTILEALGIFQRFQFKAWEIFAFDKLVQLYNVQGKYAESLEILETNLAYHRKTDNVKFTAIAYRMMGDIYLVLEEYENARTVLDSSLNITNSYGFKQERVKTLFSRGKLEYETQNFEQARQIFEEGLSLSQDLEDALFICSNYLGIGKCLYEKKEYDGAIQNLEASIEVASRIGNTEKLMEGHLFLSRAYEALGQPVMALSGYKNYKQFSDSIIARENQRQFAELISKYETEKKEQQISLLQDENEAAKVNNRRVVGLWMLTIIVGALMVAILVLAWRKNRQLLANEKQLDKIKSRFFANISHEFRTPLTLILGPLHDLQKKEEAEPFRTELKMIEKNAGVLLRLINQILDLSKLDAGKYRLHIVRADFMAMMKRAVQSFHSLAEMKKIDLSFHADAEVQEINFAPENVETIFNNLMSNALKFEPEGGRIEVKVVTREIEKKGYVTWMVTNQGSYISPEDLHHVFDRFFQSEITPNSGTGTGIGLALIRELVALHGGTIHAESSREMGTRFTVRLPATTPLSSPSIKGEPVVTETADLPVAETAQPPVTETADPGKNEPEGAEYPAGDDVAKWKTLPVVLIVEDHEEVMNYIHTVLENEYHVEKAGNGNEGIERAKMLIPDIIISDVMMPENDGIQLSHELKNHELTSHIPIILLTAKASMESRLEGLETKADDYLTKPFHGDELKLRVRNLLDARKKLRQKYSKELIITSQNLVVKSMDKVFMEKVCQTIEDNIANEEFSVEELSGNIGLSRSQLHRKLEAISAKTASQFIREYRLERARELIEKNAGTIAEISYRVGFNSPGYFNKSFKDYFKITPGELRKSVDLQAS